MGSLSHDVAVPHHQNQVSLPDGGQPVRHDKGGSPLHHGVERLLNLQLRPGIDGGGSLIQKQHGRQAEHDPCNAQKLLLSLRQASAGLPNHRVIPLWQPLDEAVGVRVFRGGDYLVVRRVRLSHGDILPDGSGLKPGILQYHSRVIEAHQQIDERGLSAARGAANGDVHTRLYRQVKAADQRFLRGIGEG